MCVNVINYTINFPVRFGYLNYKYNTVKRKRVLILNYSAIFSFHAEYKIKLFFFNCKYYIIKIYK
jgi:hypothetical protein